MTYLKLKTTPVNGNFNNLLENIFSPRPYITGSDYNGLNPGKAVPVNITESKSGYEIEIAAPGFLKEDFKINLEKNLLTISAEVNSEAETDKKTIRNEFKKQSFQRSFTIDENVETENISAQYVNGILTLNLQKKVEVRPEVKQINIA
jgi:HSP20 family protein